MFYGERSTEGRVHQPGCQDHPRPEEPQETGGRKEQVCSILQTSGFDFEMHECWFRSEYSTGFGEIHKISNTTETKQTRSLILRAYPFLISGTNGHPRANMTVTHLEVLAGKKGTIGTWSMEKSKAKHAATEDIPDAQFYEILARYALTKEQLEENGYPVFASTLSEPDGKEYKPGEVVFKVTRTLRTFGPSALAQAPNGSSAPPMGLLYNLTL